MTQTLRLAQRRFMTNLRNPIMRHNVAVLMGGKLLGMGIIPALMWTFLPSLAHAQGGTPDVPTAPRTALSGLLRGRIEDLAGLALFKLDKPAEAATRLRRAVVTSTEGTPLWRSAMWHLGGALEATGKNDQALLYYIKSYVNGPPDPARRSVIENVYKKVNGTLDGLDDKIGPGFAAASASPSPTP